MMGCSLRKGEWDSSNTSIHVSLDQESKLWARAAYRLNLGHILVSWLCRGKWKKGSACWALMVGGGTWVYHPTVTTPNKGKSILWEKWGTVVWEINGSRQININKAIMIIKIMQIFSIGSEKWSDMPWDRDRNRTQLSQYPAQCLFHFSIPSKLNNSERATILLFKLLLL